MLLRVWLFIVPSFFCLAFIYCQIEKDGEIERLSTEASELHRSKRQLNELLEQKDLEISEKSAAMKSYLDKIVRAISSPLNFCSVLTYSFRAILPTSS